MYSKPRDLSTPAVAQANTRPTMLSLSAASLLAMFCVMTLLWLPTPVIAMESTQRLGPGEQSVLQFPKRVTRVALSNPDVISVNVSDSRELLVTANQEGSSVLSVWLAGDNEPQRSNVVVSQTAGQAMPFGTQVQTDIRILEVSRSQLNQFGFNYGHIFSGGSTSAGITTGGSGFTPPQGAGAAVGAAGGEGFNLFRLGRNSTTVINALERGGFAFTLAEPSLTALSGQTATFLSGGEFPVPTRGGGNEGIQVEFKNFGVGLALTPTVLSGDQIILKVAPEVSELDFSAGVQADGINIPGLRVRRTETTVSLAPGETFIISGLVSRNTINDSARLPGLGNLPILGAFFRSSRVARDDKELIMVVTPHIVSPQQGTHPPAPLPGAEYGHSSTRYIDMMTETRRGSQPIRHGLSW